MASHLKGYIAMTSFFTRLRLVVDGRARLAALPRHRVAHLASARPHQRLTAASADALRRVPALLARAGARARFRRQRAPLGCGDVGATRVATERPVLLMQTHALVAGDRNAVAVRAF